MAIIGIVTALVMVRYGAFNSVVLLKNQAFEIALDLREAQVFAISARGSGSGSVSEFREEYGVYFAKNSPTSYIFFRDNGTDNPPRYNTGEMLGTPRLLDNRFEIIEICVNTVTVTESCQNSRDNLAVSFARPDFDAKFFAGGSSVNSAYVTIAGVVDPSVTRSIIISATGQITVQ